MTTKLTLVLFQIYPVILWHVDEVWLLAALALSSLPLIKAITHNHTSLSLVEWPQIQFRT